MQRTLENLILKNEDYFFDGDLIINGKVNLTNANLQVSGNLFLKSIFNTSSYLDTVCISKGNIEAHSLKCRAHKLHIYNGNILVDDMDVCHVSCTGNIEVKGSCHAYNINCQNYLVSGNNDSDDITAKEGIYILGYNCSGDLRAKEILLGDFSKFSPYRETTVVAQHFECAGPLLNCRGMKIG